MIRNNHIIHNHGTVKKIGHLLLNPFEHINSRRLKHIIAALILVFITGSVIKSVYVSIICARKVYSYSNVQIEQLKNNIETNEAWILFNKHFPDLISSPSLPNYFQNGTSYPAFLYTKNIPYEKEYMLNLWLFAKVDSFKKEISLKSCILKMIVLKNNTAMSAYELTEKQTMEVLQQPTVEKIISYLKENVYRP